MRLIPLFVAVVAAIVLFMSAPMGTGSMFASTEDYIRQCNSNAPSDQCQAGFRSAAVKLAAENNGRYCDTSGASGGQAKSGSAWVHEIPRLVAWLEKHPQLGSQGYSDSLQTAMVAVYPCR
jgi:hypothetical protein